jgi:hypothetical protein
MSWIFIFPHRWNGVGGKTFTTFWFSIMERERWAKGRNFFPAFLGKRIWFLEGNDILQATLFKKQKWESFFFPGGQKRGGNFFMSDTWRIQSQKNGLSLNYCSCSQRVAVPRIYLVWCQSKTYLGDGISSTRGRSWWFRRHILEASSSTYHFIQGHYSRFNPALVLSSSLTL